MSQFIYAIIPARGGSKGLPGKNIKLLGGKPLIQHTIEAARQSGIFHEIIVSTDSAEIAHFAERAGASVPFLRPLYLAEDNSLAVDAYLYTIAEIEKRKGISINLIAILQPTSPLRSQYDIQEAHKLFIDKDADSVISYVRENHPLSWHKFIKEDLTFEDIFNDIQLKNRQDFKPSFYPNGAIYFFKKDFLLTRKYYSNKSFAYIMPRERSVDIDDLEDFKYAEFLLSRKL